VRPRRARQNHEPRIRRVLVETGPAFDVRGDEIDEVRRIAGVSSSWKHDDRSTMEIADPLRRPLTAADANTDRTVPARLPRNVRVEPHETRISNQIHLLCQMSDQLRGEERGTHPPKTVRVVHADPEDHPRLRTRATTKIRRLPGTFK
jgi:hypothetical protein